VQRWALVFADEPFALRHPSRRRRALEVVVEELTHARFIIDLTLDLAHAVILAGVREKNHVLFVFSCQFSAELSADN
jgi:hypothetical protein